MNWRHDHRRGLRSAIRERGSLARRFERLAIEFDGGQQSPRDANSPAAVELLLELPLSTGASQQEAAPWLSNIDGAVARAGLSEFDPASAEPASLRGAEVLLRGVTGELWVRDQLTNGSLALPDGIDRVEILDFHREGADLKFTGRSLTAEANVKIAHDADVIEEHFLQHPKVPIIYASSDAAADARERGFAVVAGHETFHVPNDGAVVVDIGRSSDEFDNAVRDVWVDPAGSEVLDGPVPWILLASVVTNAVRRVRRGVEPATAARASVRDLTAGLTGLGVGKAAAGLGAGEPMSAAAALLGSALWRATVDARSSWSEAIIGDSLVASRAEHLVAQVERLA